MSNLTLTAPVVNPTKANPAGVYIFHNREDRISLGVQLAADGTATAALAVCAPRDQFSRPRAQYILRARLAACKTDRERSLTFDIGTYKGSEFKNDVFTPMMKYLRDNAYLYLVRGPGSFGHQNELLMDLVAELSGVTEHPSSNLGWSV